MAYASVPQVTTRLMRAMTAEETAAAAEFLDDVEADILNRYPDILSGDASRLRQLLKVECAVVIRAIRNPEGLRQTSRTRIIDDYTETDTGTVSDGSAAGLLELTADEWARLAPSGAVSQAFTITSSWARCDRTG